MLDVIFTESLRNRIWEYSQHRLVFFARKRKMRTRNSYHCSSNLLHQRNICSSIILCLSIIKSVIKKKHFKKYINITPKKKKCTPNIKINSSFKDLVSLMLNAVFGENSYCFITGMQLVIEAPISCRSDFFILLKHFSFWI